jgi:xylulokinase
MKRFILAHDLGTTGNKATLFDEQANMAASAFSGYEVIHPEPTWAEQNPADHWNAVVNTTRQLLARAKVAPDEIAAISFSGQMMGCLPVDKKGQPLRNCIIWADQRGVKQAAQLADRVG